jgi:hypothetical protein
MFITIATAYASGVFPSISMNELGQIMSSSSPNAWSNKCQRSKRTTGTTKPASPHQQIQLRTVSFILSNVNAIGS